MAQFLSGEGLDIAFASPDANGFLSEVKPQDIFFVDIQLPGWQPGDMFRRIARDHPTQSVVLMTGLPADIAQLACTLAEQSGLRVLGIYFKDGNPDQINPILAIHHATHVPLQCPPAPDAGEIRAQVRQLLDAGEIVFAFQPRVDVETFRFAGAETLLPETLPRLCGATPLLTAGAIKGDAALSYRLHMEAVRQAAQLCRAWQARGASGPVGINMPGECLEQPEFLRDLGRIVSGAGLSPRDITIELLEDTRLDNSAILSALVALRVEGYGLALDDVGQRESGLLRLASLPVTEIKIDRSLVHAARDWARAQAVYQHLCSMARSMGIATVAEGIETRADIRTSTLCGVHFLQGFHFGRKQSGQALLGTLSGTPPQLTEWPGETASFP